MMKPLLAMMALMGLAGPAAACTVTSAPFGALSTGEAVRAWTVANDVLKVTLLDYGGVLYAVEAPDRDGKSANVVRNLGSLAAYERTPVFSALVGRVAGRIGGGGFTLDGKRFALASGANGVASHGGPGGFDKRMWRARPTQCGVTLSLSSPDGHNGYPGALETSVHYRLQGSELKLEYEAASTRPTVFNPTHHVYFNLSGAPTVYEHVLQLNAARRLEVDAKRVATGAILPVSAALDFRHPKRIGAAVQADDAEIRAAGGLDVAYMLDGQDAARLADPASGRTLQVSTSAPAVIAYSAFYFDGKERDAAGAPLAKGGALALETQFHPNALNVAHFPSIVLRPGQVFRSWTAYRFGVDNSAPGITPQMPIEY